MELSCKGYTQSEIACILKVGIATVNRDLHAVRAEFYQKKEELGELIYEEHHKTLYAFNQILKELWKIFEDPNVSNKERMKVVSILLDGYSKRLHLLDSTPMAEQIKSVITDYKDQIRKMQGEMFSTVSDEQMQELWDLVDKTESGQS